MKKAVFFLISAALIIGLSPGLKSAPAKCKSGNCKNGTGVAETAKGGRYEGQFKNGKPNGKGTLTLPNGYRYEGQFRNGKKDGQGTAVFSNGKKYVGHFKNGKANGKGVLYDKNGTELKKGIWVNGKFKKGK